jgi:HEPN domain-containing protein
MPHDPELVAETRAWLVKARDDIAAGDHGLSAEPPFLGDVLFHAQQAAEKSLKALLTWHERPFRKTHSLEELGEQCLAIVPELAPLVDSVAPLTEYAWKYRYPGEPEEPDLAQAVAGLQSARALYDAVASRLPGEAHPGARTGADGTRGT